MPAVLLAGAANFVGFFVFGYAIAKMVSKGILNLDLLPGITVIVGPNGCGKSNVFDSIRWALAPTREKPADGEIPMAPARKCGSGRH